MPRWTFKPGRVSRSGSKSLEVLAVLAALFLIACTIFLGLIAFGVGQFQSPADDYPQSDLIINRLVDTDEIWRPLCVSPSGEYLVAGGFKQLSWVAKWNEKNRATKEIQHLEFDERVESLTFSKDGSHFAIYLRGRAAGIMAVFDAGNRQLVTKWPTSGFQHDVKLLLSDDGKLVFANPIERSSRLEDFQAITAWETSTGKLLSSIKTPKKFDLGDFGFFRGRLFIAYERMDDYREIQIYESEKPFSRASFVVSIKAPGASSFSGVRFSADGTSLAVPTHFCQPTLVYNLSDGRLVSELPKAYGGTSSDGYPGFALSKTGKFLATSNSNEGATLWSVATSKELGTLQGPRNGLMDNIVFGLDDKTLITCNSHVLVIWDISRFMNQEE
jgi:WD40 repeat protein